MRGDRRGIVLPAVLATIVALGLLASLALFDAVLEWRVAGLAEDQVLARAALLEAIDGAASPPDLAALCLRPPLAPQSGSGTAAAGGSWRVRWHHLGGGLVRAELEGRGRMGSRARAIALVVPDSGDRSSGGYGCPAATRLLPAGPGWLEGHPEG